MKIAVTATGPSLDDQVEPRFGRTPYYIFVDSETMAFEALRNPNASAGGGVGIQSAQLMSERDVQYVLTGNVGPNASQVFEAAGIHIAVEVTGTVRQAVEKFNAGAYTPTRQPNVESHFGMGGGGAEQVHEHSAGEVSTCTGSERGMGMGGGRGMGMGGGRGMGMGGGRGMGMGGGRGMGMGGGRGMGTGAAAFAHEEPTASDNVDALKEQAALLEKQLQDIKRKIDRAASGNNGGVAMVNEKECSGCGACMDSCPVNAISLKNRVASIDEDVCTGCGKCVDGCPLNAISMKA
jgi:predicted Fe-Mo cluster-binding NifX family protein/ferredoxin